ncbi:MAG: tripartite tricarboxylate transporter TctB family protein [Rhodobacteraceae bacterium]|nr:tripartite tricarboxylate transporter TctB family protein [Paracoccaceae bacterium]
MILRRDFVVGAVLIALAVAMIWGAQGFPRIRAMPYGPDLFPKIIAGGLILSALGIILEGLRNMRSGQADDSTTRGTITPLAALSFLGIVALVAGFALLLPVLGFHVAAALVLLCAVRIFGGNWVLAGIMAVFAPVVLHYIFYTVMRVVLPWGVLASYAW